MGAVGLVKRPMAGEKAAKRPIKGRFPDGEGPLEDLGTGSAWRCP